MLQPMESYSYLMSSWAPRGVECNSCSVFRQKEFYVLFCFCFDNHHTHLVFPSQKTHVCCGWLKLRSALFDAR